MSLSNNGVSSVPFTSTIQEEPFTARKHGSEEIKARVIGIYGIPGSGKSFLLKRLEEELKDAQFLFYEGSDVIASLIPGGLEAFQMLSQSDKYSLRQRAIDTIGQRCSKTGRTAVVTGHFMFWPEDENEGENVCTPNDLDTYSHIFYLDVPINIIEQRIRDDPERKRLLTKTAHLLEWQKAEQTQLRRLCRDHGIIFSLLPLPLQAPDRVSALLQGFCIRSEADNLRNAEHRLDEMLANYQGRLQTALVLDADRTLAAEDTGMLFWRRVVDSRQDMYEEHPLKLLFGGPFKYSYSAFKQAVMLYEEAASDEQYESLCKQVARDVTMYPEFVSLLRLVADQKHIGVVVVSSGLRQVWEEVLEREGLSKTVNIIAGGRIKDDLVVTAEVKAAIVARLQTSYQAHVWAFGDSPLDLDMMKKADEAVVVVGEEQTRSKSMDAALVKAIEEGLCAFQVTLPSGASPRLTTTELPLVDLNRIELISKVFCHHDRPTRFPLFLATHKSAAKLLATPMRDSTLSGPALRTAHSQAGRYLACEYLARIVGIEEFPISHVLGSKTVGYRLMNEGRTTIVALMRAGEPMASGVSQAIPLAMFVHASRPEDIKAHHLQDQAQIVLVDSVVNSGKTVMEFVEKIRHLDAKVPIIVVAGVVQANCISPNSELYKALSSYGNTRLVALRLSDTKFTGSGTTDTGNRLFNTTHLLR